MWFRALLLLAATLVVCWPAWMRGDWSGTEGRRLQIALEMLQSGDWMVPTIGGEPTWAKPPLHYWLLATCVGWFGDGYLWPRLPAVLGMFGAALLASELLRAGFGARAGWVGSLGIVCSPMVAFVWPTAEIDPMFACLTAASLWCLAAGVSRERPWLVVASGVVGGLAFLQKGPPFYLFACGAYLVWARHRRLRYGLLHFVPMLAVVAAYFVPLWAIYVDPAEMLAIANEESVGRIQMFRWKQVQETPGFWLRAAMVQMPFVLWCFWEWRGARDARMSAGDLTLRMCSGGAVLAVVLLTLFPGRPTRYLLPNVLLFTFAVAPAVAHFYAHRGALPSFVRGAMRVLGVGGSLALVVIPFIPRFGVAAAGLALACAVIPLAVRWPRDVVVAALLLPIIAAWTVGLERSLHWNANKRASGPVGQLLRRELDRRDAAGALATYGHVDAPLLLAAGLLPAGSESRKQLPEQRWLLREDLFWQPFASDEHVERLRLSTARKTYVLHERPPQ